MNWLNPSLYLADTPNCGKGVFAAAPLRRGEILAISGGRVRHVEQELGDQCLQVHEEFVIGLGADEPLESADCMNHSCEPNVGFASQVCMVARRDIEAGEECCWDYAMSMQPNENSATYFQMKCLCGAPQCRGEITEDDWQRPDLQSRYAGYFQPYLSKRIKLR